MGPPSPSFPSAGQTPNRLTTRRLSLAPTLTPSYTPRRRLSKISFLTGNRLGSENNDREGLHTISITPISPSHRSSKHHLPIETYKLVVLGGPRVGKTAIVQRFLYDKFPELHAATVEELHKADYDVKGLGTVSVEILDTSGSFEFPAMKRLAITGGEFIYIVFNSYILHDVRILLFLVFLSSSFALSNFSPKSLHLSSLLLFPGVMRKRRKGMRCKKRYTVFVSAGTETLTRRLSSPKRTSEESSFSLLCCCCYPILSISYSYIFQYFSFNDRILLANVIFLCLMNELRDSSRDLLSLVYKILNWILLSVHSLFKPLSVSTSVQWEEDAIDKSINFHNTSSCYPHRSCIYSGLLDHRQRILWRSLPTARADHWSEEEQLSE